MKRTLFKITGVICIGLGVAGIPIPVLPTTPFLLLAAYFFCKSDPRLYKWLLNNKLLGKYIENYTVKKKIPIKEKIYTLTLLWAGISFSAFAFNTPIAIKLLLLGIAIGVSAHVLSFRS
ncbi:MAG: YbaN family protein [Bacteroidales bacterium]